MTAVLTSPQLSSCGKTWSNACERRGPQEPFHGLCIAMLRAHRTGPRQGSTECSWQPQAPHFSTEILSFLSPCPLASLPNTGTTPGIKCKRSTNTKQRLEIECHSSRSQEIPETGSHGKGTSSYIFFSLANQLHFSVWGLRQGLPVPRGCLRGSQAHIRLHAGCALD